MNPHPPRRHPARTLLWTLLLLVPTLSPSRALADSTRARCTSVAIQLPDAITFHRAGGDIRARVYTNLAPGKYSIRYAANEHQFVISPLGTTQAVLEVSLNGDDNAAGRRYQACIASMRRNVPLVVVGHPKAPAASAPKTALSAYIAVASAQPWANDVNQLAADKGKPLSAAEVQHVLQRQGIPGAPQRSAAEVVRDPRRKRQWEALEPWEKDLWNEFLRVNGDVGDITDSPDELSVDASVRKDGMAAAARHREGADDAGDRGRVPAIRRVEAVRRRGWNIKVIHTPRSP